MPLSPAEVAPRLKALADRWAGNTANEIAVFQSWFTQFCDALGVPLPATPPTDDDRFEKPVGVVDREGITAANRIDYWRAGHAAVEAKASAPGESPDRLLRRAFGQVRNYASHIPGPPVPYIVVVDVPKTLMVWDRWSGAYGDYPAGMRISLAALHERPDDIALLQDILAQPHARDPRGKALAVSQEIATKLAELSATFERRGLDPERVARFLMRCVFCFFAEDVGLLPVGLFKRTLENARTAGGPDRVGAVLTNLWQTMDTGGDFGADLLHRFNGHFFQSVESIPLEGSDVTLLIDAATFDWAKVEPSIFGTLLVRALDPEERHRLGAEYTPRAYIERLVEPTVVEPIRERWTAVQGAVVQLEETGKKKDRDAAVKQLRDFHGWMRGLRFLDPACGSGNFLYVTMAAVKRIELEVIREIERVGGREQTEAILEEVHPRQFHGIEIKHWAREIAELTLWIGYHQFWRESHGGRTPPDPILEDTGTIECRDAILAWDDIVHRPEKDRPDPTPRIVHPVTGELVPDPAAKRPYMEYVGARQAEWPQADFIVGNPPYVGQARMRDVLGDGYVDAVRSTYPALPSSIDLVMYWWHRSALSVGSGRTERAGLITTSSLTQPQNRRVIEHDIREMNLLRWAIPSHPWVDGEGAADVRVAMTVLGRPNGRTTLLSVAEDGAVILEAHPKQLNADLTSDADIGTAAATQLSANQGLAHDGVKLHGSGFLLSPTEVQQLDVREATMRPYLNGRDVAARSRGLTVIDFGLMEEAEARRFPVSFDLVRTRVLPHREGNRRDVYRTYWWRFGEPRRQLREAIRGLDAFIATVDTARHRYFLTVPVETVVDDKLVAVASSDTFLLGVLGSSIHIRWALSAGGRLGVGNDAVYIKTLCFDPFPFPDPPATLRDQIGALAERLDAHRKDAIARDERVTMTGMYNVVEKVRSGEALTPKERAIHEIAACGVLKDLHDELDALVAQSYGWPWPMEKEEILERLVALHDERVEEEKRGVIRWLRPEYQIPRFAPTGSAPDLGLLTEATIVREAPATAAPTPWPTTAVEQLGAIGAVLSRGPATAAGATAAFTGAHAKLVERHLETLALLGEAVRDAEGRYAKVGR